MATVTNTAYEVRLDIVDDETAIALEKGAMFLSSDELKVFDSTSAKKVILSNPSTVTAAETVTATNLNDIVVITAQNVALVLANPTGTFAEGQTLTYRIKDNGTSRAISYGNKFREIGVTLPTSTTAGKITYLRCVYNSTDSKFDVILVSTQA